MYVGVCVGVYGLDQKQMVIVKCILYRCCHSSFKLAKPMELLANVTLEQLSQENRRRREKKACRSTHNASNLTSKLFSSYTFIAVIHKCLVLIAVVNPCLEMVSSPNGGLNLIVVPLVAALAPPNRTAVTVKSALQKLCQIESIVPCLK